MVPYHDFQTKETVWIPKAELSPGVVEVRIAGQEGTVYVDAARLKQGACQHPPFEGQMRDEIQSVADRLADVCPRTYEQWEDGFRRDMHPMEEIAGWDHVAAILDHMSKHHNFSQEERKECFKVLVACYTGARATVRDRSNPKMLSNEQVEQATKYFYEGGYSSAEQEH